MKIFSPLQMLCCFAFLLIYLHLKLTFMYGEVQLHFLKMWLWKREKNGEYIWWGMSWIFSGTHSSLSHLVVVIIIIVLTFIQCLLFARNCSKNLPCINTCNPYNSMSQRFIPFFRWGNWDTKRLSNLLKFN